MKGSKWIAATALTLALSGGALAQDRAWKNDSNRAPVQSQQERRPAADHTMHSQPAPQWQQGRDQDENRNRATSQWQERRDGDRAIAQWQQERRDGDRATAQWQQERRDDDRDRRDGNDRYRNVPVYPTTTYYPARVPNGVYAYRTQGLSEAQQIGFQDGLNDGAHDRQTGHSYRPTQDSNYQHANRGWNSSMIDRDSYSSAYRQAYMQGYQRGYGSGWGY